MLEDLITHSSNKKRIMGQLDNIYKDIVNNFGEEPQENLYEEEHHYQQDSRGHSSLSKENKTSQSGQGQFPKKIEKINIHTSTIANKSPGKRGSIDSDGTIQNNKLIINLQRDNEWIKSKISNFEALNDKLLTENTELKKQIIEQNNMMLNLQRDMNDIKNLVIHSVGQNQQNTGSDYKKPQSFNLPKKSGNSTKTSNIEKESSKKLSSFTMSNTMDGQGQKQSSNCNEMQTTEEKNQNTGILNLLIIDCLSNNTSTAELDDINLCYNFKTNDTYQDTKATQGSKSGSSHKMPALNFGGERNKEKEKVENITLNHSSSNSNNAPKTKKKFVSERDVKNSAHGKDKNKQNDQDKKNFDTEYSFSEEFHENHEETKVKTGKIHVDKLNFNQQNQTNDNFGTLNLENLTRTDFNDEFIQYYDDFSPSWRKACEDIHLRKKGGN